MPIPFCKAEAHSVFRKVLNSDFLILTYMCLFSKVLLSEVLLWFWKKWPERLLVLLKAGLAITGSVLEMMIFLSSRAGCSVIVVKWEVQSVNVWRGERKAKPQQIPRCNFHLKLKGTLLGCCRFAPLNEACVLQMYIFPYFTYNYPEGIALCNVLIQGLLCIQYIFMNT